MVESLENMMKEVDHDLKLDKSDLMRESIRTPYLYSKYLKYWTMCGLACSKIQKEYDILYKERWEYYNGKATDEVYKEEPFDTKVLRADVPIYLKADPKLAKVEEKLEYFKMRVDFLEKTLSNIEKRQWNIKNAIEWKKFQEGVI